MEEVIFFLKLENALPKWYYQFSLNFSECGVKLIPVSTEEFWKIIQGPKQHSIIVPLINLTSKQKFNQKNQGLFERGIKNSKISLFLLSSFFNDQLQKKWKRYPNFFNYDIPSPINELAKKIALEFYSLNEGKLEYPYGVKLRSKLDNILKGS